MRSTFLRRKAGNVSRSGIVGIAGLLILLGSELSWAGPPNPTQSDGGANTAGGTRALIKNMGSFNTGFGGYALSSNISGVQNTAFGAVALRDNTTGDNNSAFGLIALWSNTTGSNNTGLGIYALSGNSQGSYNTALGAAALGRNTFGNWNTASGASALESNTEGLFNAAHGTSALFKNTTGNDNTALGVYALFNNTIGSKNTAIGFEADVDAGVKSIITNGTALGNGALVTASNSIVLGNTSISKIYAHVTTITGISDRRRKKDIRALDADLGLDFIEKLQPVSYRFNNGDETERYGFIAQDLEQALPASLHDTIERSEPEHGLALIERQNDKDRTYRVSYGELFAPIVKAIQQQQQEIEAARQQNAELRHALAAVED